MFARALQSTGARRYWVIWGAVVPIALWAVVRTFGLESGGALTALMCFTPYAAIAALLTVGRRRRAAQLGGGDVAAVAPSVSPLRCCRGRSAASRATGRPSDTHRALGQRLPRRSEPDALDRPRRPLPTRPAQRPGADAVVRRARCARRHRSAAPHSVLMPQPKGHGGGLYSRYPPGRPAHQTHFLFRMPRACSALPDGRRLRVIAIHPQPPNMGVRGWRGALEACRTPAPAFPGSWSATSTRTFDQAEFREVVDSGYRDAGEATGKGLQPTWPAPTRCPLGGDHDRPRPRRPPPGSRGLRSCEPGGQRPPRGPRAAGAALMAARPAFA